MINIEIRRPSIEDRQAINEFFEVVLKHTFEKEGIIELTETLEEEIIDKRRCFDQDIQSQGRERYFLIALIDDCIIGSIEYGVANDLITRCTDGALSHLNEIGTVFVHPDHQRKGLGNLLLNAIYQAMNRKGIKEFCLDSGYKTAQKIWIKKYGLPTYHLKDYWDEGADHMVWRVELNKLI